jgi:hypothetical protein
VSKALSRYRNLDTVFLIFRASVAVRFTRAAPISLGCFQYVHLMAVEPQHICISLNQCPEHYTSNCSNMSSKLCNLSPPRTLSKTGRNLSVKLLAFFSIQQGIH